MGEVVRNTTKDVLKNKENQEKARKYTKGQRGDGLTMVWAELDTSWGLLRWEASFVALRSEDNLCNICKQDQRFYSVPFIAYPFTVSKNSRKPLAKGRRTDAWANCRPKQQKRDSLQEPRLDTFVQTLPRVSSTGRLKLYFVYSCLFFLMLCLGSSLWLLGNKIVQYIGSVFDELLERVTPIRTFFFTQIWQVQERKEYLGEWAGICRKRDFFICARY